MILMLPSLVSERSEVFPLRMPLDWTMFRFLVISVWPLRNATLYNADLRNSNCPNAILKNAYVSDADLTDPIVIPGTDLTKANLSYTVLNQR